MIQKVQLKDLPVIEFLAREIWTEHYEPIIGLAQIDYMLEKFQSVSAMVKQIEEGMQYYKTSYEGKLVGYLAYKLEDDKLFLSKIYLLKAFRGKGLGKEMFTFVQDKAAHEGKAYIRLTVNKNNESWKAYEAMGFERIESAIFDIGNGYVMDDYVYCYTL